MQDRQNQEGTDSNSPKADNSLIILELHQFRPLKNISLWKKLYHYKTPFDRSKYSCLENCVRGTTQSFIIGFSIKAVLAVFRLLIGPEKLSYKSGKLLAAVFGFDNIRFGSFLGLLTGITKLILSLLRILRKKDDGMNGFLATFVGAYLSLFFLPKQSRSLFSLFLLPRAFDCCYNHFVNNNKFKRRGWHFVLLFALMNMFTVYNYTSEEYLIPHSIEKFYNMVLCPSENDLIKRRLCSEIARRSLVKKGIIQDLCHIC